MARFLLHKMQLISYGHFKLNIKITVAVTIPHYFTIKRAKLEII